MNVCVLAKDELEAKGIEWMIQSHMPAVSMHAVENEAALKRQIQEQRRVCCSCRFRSVICSR